MPGLKIPKEYERGIELIKSLSESDVLKVSQILKDSIPASKRADIVSTLQSVLKVISTEDIANLVDAIYSLYFYRSHYEVSVEDFSADLLRAIKESENMEIQTTEAEALAVLERKLKSLLTVPSLSTLAKARELRVDFANIFLGAKIMSDIRPVWGDDVKVPPAGIVITQTLKLEYGDIDGSKELYVSLKSEDIETLFSVLQRARDKMEILKSLATERWMKILQE